MSETIKILLRGLVDDAGLFPPTALPMRWALERHREDQRASHPMHTGRFLCPASRWTEFREALEETDRIDVGLIVDTEEALAEAAADGDPRVRVAHYEAKVPGVDIGKTARYLRAVAGAASPKRKGLFARADARPSPRSEAGRPVYVELDRGRSGRDSVAELAGAPGLGAKVRCGGTKTEAFPSPDELSAFIAACVEHAVPFKATAGLHHAVLYTDPDTGFRHFGYLNLLLATAAAVAGDGPNRVRGTLVIGDPDELTARIRGIDRGTAARTRELFHSYGSCSTRSPVTDARGLGLLPRSSW